MTPSAFARIGEALFGYGWPSLLSDALSVNLRNVQRWAAGEAPIPEGIPADLARVARERFEAVMAQIEVSK